MPSNPQDFHREHELDSLVRNLVDALNGHIPSNMLLYGVPGSGKPWLPDTS